MFTFLVCGVSFLRFSIVFHFTYFILSLRLLLIILLSLFYSALGAHLFCLVIFLIVSKVFFAVLQGHPVSYMTIFLHQVSEEILCKVHQQS